MSEWVSEWAIQSVSQSVKKKYKKIHQTGRSLPGEYLRRLLRQMREEVEKEAQGVGTNRWDPWPQAGTHRCWHVGNLQHEGEIWH